MTIPPPAEKARVKGKFTQLNHGLHRASIRLRFLRKSNSIWPLVESHNYIFLTKPFWHIRWQENENGQVVCGEVNL
jgi:hypothetical protein